MGRRAGTRQVVVLKGPEGVPDNSHGALEAARRGPEESLASGGSRKAASVALRSFPSRVGLSPHPPSGMDSGGPSPSPNRQGTVRDCPLNCP